MEEGVDVGVCEGVREAVAVELGVGGRRECLRGGRCAG